MSAVRGVWAALLVTAATALAVAAGEAPVTPSEIVRQLADLDGAHVTVTGTLGQVRTHVSKKGERSYSFSLSDDTQAVTVLTRARPGCRPGGQVVVEGIVDRLSRRIDASLVSCR